MADASGDPSPKPIGTDESLRSVRGPLAELARLIERDEAFAVNNRAPHVGASAGTADEVPSLLATQEGRPEPDWDYAQVHDVPRGGGAFADGIRAQERPAPPMIDWEPASTPDQATHAPPKRRSIGKLKTLPGLALAACVGAYGHWLWSEGIAGKRQRQLAQAASPIPHPDDGSDGRWGKLVQEPFREIEPSASQPRQMFPLDGGVLYSAPTVLSEAQRTDATEESHILRPGTDFSGGLARPEPTQSQRASGSPDAPAKQASARPGQDARSALPRATITTPAQPSTARPSEGAPAPIGSFVVQLSLHRSEGAAEAAVRELRRNYPDVFEGYRPVVVRTELGDTGVFYRAEVGPFANSELANQFCSSLKKLGGHCVVHN